MSALIPEILLPNGMKIFYLQSDEVKFLYEQVQGYCKNGIELHEGDTVFDVGANIGLFTLRAYELCNKNVNVYAFEPIPAIFEVLHRNAQRFDPEKLKVFPYGLSDESKNKTFAYLPNATGLSTAYLDGSKQERDEFKNTILRNLGNAPNYIGWIRVLRWLPPFLRSYILDKKIEKAFHQIEQVTCHLKTVSEVVREYNIHRIDLLKVDVEKSELDVLLGIEDQDWAKIKQVFVEVDDWNRFGEKIMSLLKKHGLSEVKVDQSPILMGSKMFNLYALRRQLE